MEFIVYSNKLTQEELLQRNIFISPQAQICEGVKLYFGVKVYGESYIGGGTELHSNAEINNSQVGCNCKIYSTIIKDCEIGANCIIKPFTHITKTHIGDNVCVGNFTCINNSSFGANTSIYSLCSISDTDVGNSATISSGVCCEPSINTISIGDNVVIGANTTIIKTVIISDNSTIDANSIITKDIDAGQQAKNNIKQINK